MATFHRLSRSDQICAANVLRLRVKTDQLFFWLLLAQWVLAIVIALSVSPYAWSGRIRSVHFHVQIAIVGGLVLNLLPLLLIRMRPGWWLTRHSIAVTQMLWSALLVHLTGGRIETHFHIFGSLAFLSLYRDWRVLITATMAVASDHLIRGLWWPESIYGIANPEWWRFLEHASWVLFEDIVLFFGCHRGLAEIREIADREAKLEQVVSSVEQQVVDRTADLKASGDKYRALLENTNAVPWELDRDSGQAIYVAPQMGTIFGIGAPDPNAPQFVDCFHPQDRDALRSFLKRVDPREPEADHIDNRIVALDNKIRHVRSFISAQEDQRYRTIVRGISLDITRQKQLEADLAQAQKLESIGQLAAGIAHEINTPSQFIGNNITFVKEGLTDLLSFNHRLDSLMAQSKDRAIYAAQITELRTAIDMDYLQTELPQAIEQSLDGVQRIQAVVGAMKEFSHPATERTPTDLNRAINTTIVVASAEWKYVAELTTDLDSTLMPVAVLPGMFNQVILNLIVNAAHAVGTTVAAQPGSKGLIRISTHRIGDSVEVRVGDSGCGIPEEIRSRIFDPFFTTKPVGKGTGQGLAIAHDVIVNKHGGTIAVESQIGVGTTFTVRIPLQQDAVETLAVA